MAYPYDFFRKRVNIYWFEACYDIILENIALFMKSRSNEILRWDFHSKFRLGLVRSRDCDLFCMIGFEYTWTTMVNPKIYKYFKFNDISIALFATRFRFESYVRIYPKSVRIYPLWLFYIYLNCSHGTPWNILKIPNAFCSKTLFFVLRNLFDAKYLTSNEKIEV